MTWSKVCFVLVLLCMPQLVGQNVDSAWRAKLSQPQYEEIRFRM